MQETNDEITTGTQCQKSQQALTPTEKAKMKYMAGSTEQELDTLLKTPRDYAFLAMTFVPITFNLKGGLPC